MDSDTCDREPDPELNRLTHAIIGASYEVGNLLGNGFLEKVYENALAKELRERGLRVEQQAEMEVRYKGDVVGKYNADLVVEQKVIVELKVARDLDDVHMAQCLNYLKATGYRICLLINFFHPKVQVKRIIR